MTYSPARRRALTLAGSIGAAALLLSACGGNDSGASSGSDDSENGGSDDLADISIGISQFEQHPALDAATSGFKDAVIDAGYVDGDSVEFDEQNAQGDVANTNTIASKFATDDLDLVLAVATPSAQAAAQSLPDVPVLFTAVTDPAEADLVDSNDSPGGNVTGTSDLNPVADQFELLEQILPDASSVGIVYSSGEVNSEVQVDLAKEAAQEMDVEISEATVSNSSEIQEATESLGDVDAIYVPTDNTVVSGLSALLQVAESQGIAVIGAEAGTVDEGAIATVGIDYERLGYQTGEMALSILDGDDPADMSVETLDELELVVNPDAADRMDVSLPDSLVDDADRVVE